MGTLTSRFPSARRLQLPGEQGDPPGTVVNDVARLIEPYLGWVLLEVDSSSTDILIGEPETSRHDGQSRSIIILGGEAAQAWLRSARKSGK